MLFIVRLTDKPDSITIRNQFVPAHREWLDRNHASVRAAGALRPEPEAPPVGACWIVEAQTKDEVETLLKTDPFWLHGVRQGYEILYWFRPQPERKVLI